jgi:biotin carboxyl carrier protein
VSSRSSFSRKRGKTIRMRALRARSASLSMGVRSRRRSRRCATAARSSIVVAAGPLAAEFVVVEGRTAHRATGLAAPEVDAPMPGKVLKVLVAEGQPVEHGEALIVLEAMKMETTLYAESPAIVAKICVVAGQMVDHGARLIELSPVATPARPPESPPQDD